MLGSPCEDLAPSSQSREVHWAREHCSQGGSNAQGDADFGHKLVGYNSTPDADSFQVGKTGMNPRNSLLALSS